MQEYEKEIREILALLDRISVQGIGNIQLMAVAASRLATLANRKEVSEDGDHRE